MVRAFFALRGKEERLVANYGELSNSNKVQSFKAKQNESYDFKLRYAETRAWEFFRHPDVAGDCYVSAGGLDSITLLVFLRSIGIDVPAVSVSVLEDKSIQEVHKQLGVLPLKPEKSKVQVIREFGWPLISKEVSDKVDALQHPTERNKNFRHTVITGEVGGAGSGKFSKNARLPQRWLEKFGGCESENGHTSYGMPDFFLSDKCCYYMKEKPCDDYRRETGRSPYMGLMASEGGRREKTLMLNGCNYISPKTKRSCPFAIFSRQDLLRLALDLKVPVPEIYGKIMKAPDGTLFTTKAQRTGCSMCGFGIHLEQRPHRFDRLWQSNPKEWEFWMNHVVQREDGSWYGWGHVLDYIGVAWRDPAEQFSGKGRWRLL